MYESNNISFQKGELVVIKIFSIAFMIAGVVFITGATSHAVTLLALDGNEYRVYLFCSDSVGDYCDRGTKTNDTFKFEDDAFIIESFEDELLGLSAHGEYSESGLSFTADFEVITDDIVDKYEFDVKGISLLDTLLFGSADITYSKFQFVGYDKEEEATAYFF